MNGQNELVIKYGLLPFSINVLDKRQTLLEKLVSLFQASFEKDPAPGISGKIRHFYDLYFLFLDMECKAFLDLKEFPVKFAEVWSHDQTAFDEPEGWQGKSPLESPLFLKFPEIWNTLKITYKKELSALAFTEIPDENKVAEAIINIIQKLPAV